MTIIAASIPILRMLFVNIARTPRGDHADGLDITIGKISSNNRLRRQVDMMDSSNDIEDSPGSLAVVYQAPSTDEEMILSHHRGLEW
jgi:hypothetical protein